MVAVRDIPLLKAKNLFTTEYDCYKVFVSVTGNQTTYKRLRLLDASDNIITGSGYSYNSNFLRHTGYTFTDATATSHGALIVDAYTNARDQAYTGKIAMTIWHPNDATNKTAIFTSHMSFSASNQVQQTLTCTGENTTAVTGLSFEAYGISEGKIDDPNKKSILALFSEIHLLNEKVSKLESRILDNEFKREIKSDNKIRKAKVKISKWN